MANVEDQRVRLQSALGELDQELHLVKQYLQNRRYGDLQRSYARVVGLANSHAKTLSAFMEQLQREGVVA